MAQLLHPTKRCRTISPFLLFFSRGSHLSVCLTLSLSDLVPSFTISLRLLEVTTETHTRAARATHLLPRCGGSGTGQGESSVGSSTPEDTLDVQASEVLVLLDSCILNPWKPRSPTNRENLA